MVVDPQVVAFSGMPAVLTITPGADMALVMKSTVAQGRRAAWLATLARGQLEQVTGVLLVGFGVLLARERR